MNEKLEFVFRNFKNSRNKNIKLEHWRKTQPSHAIYDSIYVMNLNLKTMLKLLVKIIQYMYL